MKKKLAIITLLLILSLTLFACGKKDEPQKETKEAQTQENTESAETKEETETPQEAPAEENTSNSEWVEENGAKRRTVKDIDFNQTFTSGPFNITIERVQAIDIMTNDEMKSMFDGKDEITSIAMSVKVENTSDDELNFYPDQAEIATDTKEQIEAEILLSDRVGGEFKGQIIKEGTIIFVANSKAEDINKLTLFIDGPSNQDFDRVGEDLKIDIDLNK